MIICTKDCEPFHTCRFTDKQRKRVVCQYTEPGRIMARIVRRDNEKWVKAMLKKTDKGMEKHE